MFVLRQRFPNRTLIVIVNCLLLVFLGFVLPYIANVSTVLIGSNASLDTMGFYHPDAVAQIARTYGSQGRFYYTLLRFTFDLVWPFVYWAFLHVNLQALLNYWQPPKPQRQALLWLPLFALCCDFGENFAITFAFWRFPTPAPISAFLASGFSLSKWISLGASFLALFLALSFVIGHWLRHRR